MIASPRIEEVSRLGALAEADLVDFLTSGARRVLSKDASALLSLHDELILAQLQSVLLGLLEFYEPSESRAWLYAGHPQLDGQKPIYVIRVGRAQEVMRIIARLDDQVFV